MPSDNSFNQSLEALKELFHSLRTPLGVALTIAKDNKNNLPLSPNDHEDAVNSLEKIRDSLDEVKPLLNLGLLKCVPLPLSEVSLICEVEGYALDGFFDEDTSVKIEVSLLKIWLQTFFNLPASKKIVKLKGDGETVTLEISVESSGSKAPSPTFLRLFAAAWEAVGIKLLGTRSESRLRLIITQS